MKEEQKKPKKSRMERKFQSYADFINVIVGSPYWFFFSVLIVFFWLVLGPIMRYSEMWHLLINTTTTILTFLMISLLHSSQKKWEDRIERLQNKEVSTIKDIKKETKKLSLEGTSKSSHTPTQENSWNQ